MRKSKWIKNHHPPIHKIKHFGILVSGAEIDISSTLHGTDWIKHKILKWTPYGISAFRRFPSEDKHSSSRKGKLRKSKQIFEVVFPNSLACVLGINEQISSTSRRVNSHIAGWYSVT